VKAKLGNKKVVRPCSYCGDESSMECTFCARMGLPATFFCTAEHQTKMWKQHVKQHSNIDASSSSSSSSTLNVYSSPTKSYYQPSANSPTYFTSPQHPHPHPLPSGNYQPKNLNKAFMK
jgi:hypothetical protein